SVKLLGLRVANVLLGDRAPRTRALHLSEVDAEFLCQSRDGPLLVRRSARRVLVLVRPTHERLRIVAVEIVATLPRTIAGLHLVLTLGKNRLLRLLPVLLQCLEVLHVTGPPVKGDNV